MPPLNGFQKSCVALAVGQALTMGAAKAAVITVNGTNPALNCTLQDAIVSANTDTATGQCGAGSGDDVVRLHSQSAVLTSPSYFLASGATAFNITSNITIEGKTIAGGTSNEAPGQISRIGEEEFRLFRVASGSSLTLNDISVQGGELSVGGENGAGVFVDGGTLTLNSSTLTNNRVATEATGKGGAVYATGSSAQVNINYSYLSTNRANNGGAIALNDGAQLAIYRSRLNRNTATNQGGGVYTSRGTSVTLTDSRLSSNSAQQSGGGVYLGAGNGTGTGAASLTVQGGEFSSNRATNGLGGAISSKYGDISIADAHFKYNQAGVFGGAVFSGFGNGQLDVADTSLISNRVVTTSSGTQTISGVGGAIALFSDNTHTISNSTISKNLAANGGGVTSVYGSLIITNSTLVGGEGIPETSGSASPQPGAILYAANEGQITLNNTVGAFGGEGFRYGGEYGQAYAGLPSLPGRVLCATSNEGGATITSGSANFFEDDTCGQPADGNAGLSRLRNSNQSQSQSFEIGAFPGGKYGSGNYSRTLRLRSGPYHTPVFNSPLLEAGNVTICTSSPINNTDQRGLTRGAGVCDIGATEAVETSILVDTVSDDINRTTADCSLRDALLLTSGGEGGEGGEGSLYQPRAAATCTGSADITTIGFDPSVFPAGARNTISLTARLPRINAAVTIQGPGTNAVRVDGGGEHPVLRASNAHLYLNNFTVANGSQYSGGGLSAFGGRLVMQSMLITGNSGRRAGGVSLSNTHFTISKTTISGNSAEGTRSVGGLRVTGRELGVIADSTISGNISTDTVDGNLSVYDVGQRAGGLYIGRGALTVVRNSTISGNQSSRTGGGIGLNNGSAFLFNSTLSNNVADEYGGGINIQRLTSGGENNSYDQDSFLALVNSIVSGNRKGTGSAGAALPAYGQDLMFRSFYRSSSTLTAGSQVGNYTAGSLIGSSALNYSQSIYSNIVNSLTLNNSTIATSLDAMGNPNPSATALSRIIGPLTANGGTTQTHILVDGSPAINGGEQSFCDGGFITPITRDQRGFPRSDGACDIGSVEYEETTCFVVKAANGKVVTFCL